MKKQNSIFCVLILSIVLSAGCGKKKDDSSDSTSSCAVLGFSGSANSGFSTSGVFTVSPLATGSIASITPLGNLNAPGHTYPTDHMYIVPTTATADANTVYAAAAGTVTAITQPAGTDYKVVIKVDSSFYYYYDHLHLANGLAVGTALAAGQTVGTNSGLAAAVDFGVVNFNLTPLAGILDSCLAQSQSYVDSPLKYYSGALATTLYGKVTVSGAATQDGKIDYDQSGKLVGDWALADHQAMDSTDYQLAFVYNVSNHGLRISVGGTLDGGAAVYGVQGGATDFASVGTGSGQVDYRLYVSSNGDTSVSGTQTAVLSVQMLSATQIKVQIFQGNTGATGTFTSSAKIYNR
jgi:hypothetical protein